MKLTHKLIKLLGGYTKDDVLAEAMSDLFCVIREEDILREDVSGAWTIAGKPLPEETKKLLAAEAQVFLKTKLWTQVLQTDVRYKASKLMFDKSQSEADLVAGKMCLYILDVIKTRLMSLEKGIGRLNSKE